MSCPARERERLVTDGFCIIPGVLDAGMLDALGRETSALLDQLTEEEKRIQGGQGASQPIPYAPVVFSELISWPRALAALADLGFDSVRYLSGFIISREPADQGGVLAPGLDVLGRTGERRSTPGQGVSHVLPGGHGTGERLLAGHSGLAPAPISAARIRRATAPISATRIPDTSVKYADAAGQIDVPITAGDLLIGDSRVLHAPRANRTDRRRTVLTMWYLPRWNELSERMRASYSANHRAFTSEAPAGVARTPASAQPALLRERRAGGDESAPRRIPQAQVSFLV